MDDEHPIVSMKAATNAGTVTSTRPVKVESRADSEKMALCSNEAAKDKDGRFIITKKVKVDSIKNLQKVPAHWPI